jgi:hypothetical protein
VNRDRRCADHVPTRNGDVDRAGFDRPGEELEEIHAGSVTDGRAVTAGEHSRHLRCVQGLHRADPVDAAVEGM